MNSYEVQHFIKATTNRVRLNFENVTKADNSSMFKRMGDWLNQPMFNINVERDEVVSKSILNNLITVNKPKYIYLKLTPMTSVRNYDSGKIIKLVASLYRSMLQRLKLLDKRLYVDIASKVGYYIYMEKHKVEFYFIVPDVYLSIIKERINDTWKGITITVVDIIPNFSNSAVYYKFDNKKEDALSLSVDARTNTLLSSMLNVLNVVEDGDKLGVLYNFVPTSQYAWRAAYERTLEKYKANQPIDKEKFSLAYILKMSVFLLLDCLDIVFETCSGFLFLDDKKQSKKVKADDTIMGVLKIQRMNELTAATKSKRDDLVVKTQVVVMSDSKDRSRAVNNGRSLCQAYKSISGDNELVYKRYTTNFKMDSYLLPDNEGMLLSPKECQNLLALPGRELLETYKCIDKIDTFESEVPVELRDGVISLGTNTYRGNKQKAYITTDKNLRNLSLVLIGPTRAGKSTLITNIAKDAIDNGECTILFDFCGNGQLSDEVSDVIHSSKVLDVVCDKFETLQGLGYNEIKTFPANDTFLRYRNAKIQTAQLLTLINSVNTSDKELSAKMDRYLESAALCVFIVGGNIKHVFSVLQDHEVRHKYLSQIPLDQLDNMEEYIKSMKTLDDVNKDGVPIGTKYSLIAGIMDRINKLKQNTYMELMLKKSCNDNINLCEEIQKNQLICLRMPEVMFTTEVEKDSYCTYWITKIWLALQIRNWHVPVEKQLKVNIVVDELYQIPNAQDFIRLKLSQMAKFTSKMIISCHYLGQIGIIRDELKAANSSYVLISGCDKDNFKELSDELKPYCLEDLLNLKRYHSLNLMRYEKGYACFITELPKPLSKVKEIKSDS